MAGASAAPHVTVVIPTFNRYDYTRRCLESLRQLAYPNLDVILVDNGSKDGTPERVHAEFPEVQLIRLSANLGYAAACNAGIRASTGPFILFLNNDTRVIDPMMMQTLVQEMEQDTRLAATGPILVDYKTLEVDNRRRFVRPGHGFALAPGSCLMVRRSALERVGLFDESFFSYFEDLDLFARLLDAGFGMRQCRETKIAHEGGATAGRSSAFTLYYQNRGFFVFARRHVPLREFVGRLLLERMWLAVWSFKLIAADRNFRLFSAWVRGYRDGLVWLLRTPP